MHKISTALCQFFGLYENLIRPYKKRRSKALRLMLTCFYD
ncbi:hypothetical protein HMPREF9065_01338 [Aggregatibacter sp. oral taxon 458 str. W10330]|nr:hypothetical protein HMPREF9065_01338 [Aggregatibacter sp. oral taxon 458 str. W10330]